uniref:Uncharacterized protein n=1 Tax=Arundo donax TaxID=35708 RepID=A0A0A9HN05_ARUDO
MATIWWIPDYKG